MSATARTERVRDDVAGAVSSLGLLVEDVTVTPAGKRRLVRVLLDRDLTELLAGTDGTSTVEPLTLDEVAEATRAVSDALDVSDAMGEQPYVLEVSSPGTERPLVEPRHFRRNVSRLVEVTQTDGQVVTGRILEAGPAGMTLDVAGEKGRPGRQVEVAYDALERARVQVEFNRGPGADAADDATDDAGADDAAELGDGEDS